MSNHSRLKDSEDKFCKTMYYDTNPIFRIEFSSKFYFITYIINSIYVIHNPVTTILGVIC